MLNNCGLDEWDYRGIEFSLLINKLWFKNLPINGTGMYNINQIYPN